MTNLLKIKKIILFVFLLAFVNINAQGDAGFDGGGNVDDQIPINGLVVVGLIAGAALGLRKTKK